LTSYDPLDPPSKTILSVEIDDPQGISAWAIGKRGKPDMFTGNKWGKMARNRSFCDGRMRLVMMNPVYLP